MALLTLSALWNDKMLAKTDAQSRAKVRSNPVPIDYSSIFKSKADAVAYAKTNPTAYPGQIIAVAENEFSEWKCETNTPSFTIEGTTVKFSNGVTKTATASADEAGEEGAKESLKLTLTVQKGDLAVPAKPGTGEDVNLTFTRTYGQTQNVYVIDGNAVNNLKKISGGAGTGSAGSGDVEAETARAMAAEQFLSSAIDAKDVTVERLATAEVDFLATYVVKQNGQKVGASINIPKDFLVKSATVKTCETDNHPVEGLVPGDKYIDFVVNQRDVEGDVGATHMYIKFKDLLKPYTFKDTDTIDFTVDDNNNVSADVRDGSIVEAKIANGAVTTAKIAENAVTTAKIEAGAVTGGKIAGNAISSEHISEKAVGTNQLADDAVTNEKIANSAVDTAQIADKAVGKDKLSEELQTVLTSLKDLQGANLAHNTDASATYIVTEQDGKLVASQKAIEISQSQIIDLSGKTLVDTNMVAVSAKESDLIARESTVDGKIADALSVLDGYVKDSELTSTLENYVPTSAVVEAVDGNDKIIRHSTLNNYLKTADFNTISTTIGLDAASNDNKVATLSDLTKLNVEGKIDEKLGQLLVEIDAGKMITAITKDDNGAFTVKTADIKIEQSAVTGLTGSLQALSDQVYNLGNSLNDYVTAENFDKYAKTTGMDRATADDMLVISSDVTAAINKALGVLDDYVPTSAVYDFKKVTADDKLVISSDVSAAIDTAIKGIGDVLHFKGVASIVGEDGAPVAVDEKYKAGDVVLDSKTSKEFVVVKTSTEGEPKLKFREIGDEHLIDQYVAKTTKINGKALTSDVMLSGGDIKVGGDGDYALSTVEEAVTDIDGRVDTLSTAVQNKVKVGDYGSELSSVNELSVVRIDGETYHNLVKNNQTDPTTMYIVQSDEANMYGERVTNVADAVVDTDAVTLGQARKLAQDTLTSVEVIDCGSAEA